MNEDRSFEIEVSLSAEEKTVIVLSILTIALMGLLSDDYIMFYFGMAFVLSGFVPAINVNKFGLLFLFSHSCSGMAILMYSFSDKIWNNPILSDGFGILNILIIISILMIVLSFATIVIYNLNAKVRKINYFITLPFIFCTLSIICFGIASILFP